MLGVESTLELESFLTACTSIQSPFTTNRRTAKAGKKLGERGDRRWYPD